MGILNDIFGFSKIKGVTVVDVAAKKVKKAPKKVSIKLTRAEIKEAAEYARTHVSTPKKTVKGKVK